MKQHRRSTGTIRALLRDTAMIRRRSRAARISVNVVASVATLVLVTGVAPSFAADVAPSDPTSTAAAAGDPATPAGDPTTPAADPTTPAADATTPAGDATTTPAEVTTTSGTTAAAPTSTAPAKPTKTPTLTRKVTTSSSLSSATLGASLSVSCTGGPGTLAAGGFEIDGNLCVDGAGNKDWDNTGEHKVDGAKDATAYKEHSAENTAVSGWTTNGSSQGKDDITDAWGWTTIASGDVWTVFGVARVTDNGTTTYDVELNHKTNLSANPAKPDRTVGDLLLQFQVTGNGPLKFDHAYDWTKKADFNSSECFESGSTGFGWCPLNTVAPPKFVSDHSADGLFAEGAINLSALASANGNICTGNFGAMNIRTVASEQHTAALQDFVTPFGVNVPSTCGTITINKLDAATNAKVGGAHFTISPDPTPGSSNPGPVPLVDGGTGDADGTANGTITLSPAQAGQYTVTETAGPAGYFLPGPASKTLTLARPARTRTPRSPSPT